MAIEAMKPARRGGWPKAGRFLRAWAISLLLASLAGPGRGGLFSSPPAPKTGATAVPVDENAFQSDAGIGLANYNVPIKPGFWQPVWIKIAAGKKAVRGTAWLNQGEQSVRVEIPIDVAPMTTKLYRTYFLPQLNSQMFSTASLVATIQAEGFDAETIPISLRSAVNPQSGRTTRQILALCEERGNYQFISRQDRLADAKNRAPLNPLDVIYGDVDLLPEEPLALAPIDAIILEGAVARRLSEGQWAAIEAWTAQGGVLILGSGRHQPFLAQSPARRPFGVELAAAEPAPFPADARTLLAGDPAADGEMLACWAPQAQAGWDRIWLGDSLHPLLAEKQVGKGRFVLCAAALDPPMRRMLEQIDLKSYFFVRLIESTPPRGAEAANQDPLLDMQVRREANLTRALQQRFTIDLAGIGWVLAFLLSYNLLAMPINWWICRRLNRPDLRWWILIATALAFAAYGYRSGAERQQKNLQVGSVTLARAAAGSSLATATSFDTIFTPRRIRGDLTAEGLVFPLPTGQESRAAQQSCTLQFGESATIRDWLIQPWTTSNFRSEFTLPAGGGVAAPGGLRLAAGGGPTGTVALDNATSYTFTRWWLINGDPAGGESVYVGEGSLAAGTRTDSAHFEPDAVAGVQGEALLYQIMETALTGSSAQKAVEANGPPPTPTSPAKPAATIRSGRWWFLGESVGFRSPLLAGFKGDPGIGMLYYEQPLEGTSKSPATAAGTWQPGSWTATATLEGLFRRETRAENDATLALPLNKLLLELKPDRAPAGSLGGAVEVSWDIDSYPRTQSDWRVNSLYFRMVAIPTQVYNFRTRQWEELGDWTGKSRRLTPAADYLDPLNATLQFQLDTTPDGVRMAAINAATVERGRPISMKLALGGSFGALVPTTDVDDHNFGYYGAPVSLCLRRIAVRYLPPTPDATQRSAP